MSELDKTLGLDANITRRDLLHDAGLMSLALGLASPSSASYSNNPVSTADYPPTRTGLRGSHPGSYEAAHAYARDGVPQKKPDATKESFDLVVVGGGISGLAAAYYYQHQFGQHQKILILDNHDDFGGHAKRNEFHQGGRMQLAIGGTHNLEYWQFNDTVNALIQDLGIDIDKLRRQTEFNYGRTGVNGRAIWFDAETFGIDRLITGCSLNGPPSASPLPYLDQFPISEAAKAQLRQFYGRTADVLADLSDDDRSDYLHNTGYFEFLSSKAGLGEEARSLFGNACHGSWGLETQCLSVAEALGEGLPGLQLLGETPTESDWDYPAGFFPDGNASLARLLVQRLIPSVAPGVNPDNIAIAAFNYSELDKASHSVRVRLQSTVTHVENRGNGVYLSYTRGGKVHAVHARHCVMACYHSILPYICPSLSETQKVAQSYQVKYPLLLTNVLIRSRAPFTALGVDGVSCPGRMHGSLFLASGIETGGHQQGLADPGSVPVTFWGSLSPEAGLTDLRDQLRSSREKMLHLRFEDYEREVRSVLQNLLGPAGFRAARDILAITVNRWPHGYSHEYLDLWDEDWPQGEAPHEVARQRFGNITFANADAGASAYTHTAIEQAARAVGELG
ncbi:MAG: FAD-dependent oxidoreductase [Pseudomonadales bacterium]